MIEDKYININNDKVCYNITSSNNDKVVVISIALVFCEMASALVPGFM